MIPPRFASALFALLLLGFMSLLVSGVATAKALGLPPDFPALWLRAWGFSWALAFPAAFLAGPVVRHVVAQLTVRQG